MATFEKVRIRRATGYSQEGILKADAGGLEWSGAEEKVSVTKEEMKGMTWTPLHFGFQLAASKRDGNVVNFTGWRF